MSNKDEDIGLRVLRELDYDSYDMPFRAQVVQAPPEVFVDDLRADNDESLNLVPRIATFAQLKEVFKLDIDRSLGYDACPAGDPYWAVIGFYVRTGINAFIPKVFDQTGTPLPHPGALVFAYWPGAPNFPEPVNPAYHQNVVAGWTNQNGDAGFGFSGGAVVGPNGGVYDFWVSADPAIGGTRFYSDAVVRVGWFGGTNYLLANAVFQATVKTGDQPQPPIGDGARLDVYDKSGAFVGSIVLSAGQQSGGRVALIQDGQETAFVRFDDA